MAVNAETITLLQALSPEAAIELAGTLAFAVINSHLPPVEKTKVGSFFARFGMEIMESTGHVCHAVIVHPSFALPVVYNTKQQD